MHKELMKISSIKFGMGGYQDAQMGIWIDFTGKNSHAGTGKGFWTCAWTPSTKWTDVERIEFLGKIVLEIAQWLEDAKVQSIDQMVGIPVEVTFEDIFGPLKSWRILTEVL